MHFFNRVRLLVCLFIFSCLCLLISPHPVFAATYGEGTYGCDAYNEGDCPQVDSLSPDSGIVGDTISIVGQNFGTFVAGVSKVFFQDILATISDWIDTLIHVIVPGGTTTGTVTVETENGIATAAEALRLTLLHQLRL